MKVRLRVFLCLLASTIFLTPVLVSGQASDADLNLSACQHGWAGCDRAKLTPSQSADLATIDHRRNVSDCRDGLKSCDHSKLSDAERTALAVADHQNNVDACNDGTRSCACERARLTRIHEPHAQHTDGIRALVCIGRSLPAGSRFPPASR